ncbi:MCE family protein [Rhodococcus oxybenzonivorans]|uniref:MCE family protein n=1 Tax=Rhodococcus oxybenzonivorans TaxID=1990687 RepID=UPI002952FD6A|nr:MCE family protein [Rhodococcus oxybenzonivorans]MDV7353891.1 MCE family protein [Rhodococcus oxybenzonivorans]
MIWRSRRGPRVPHVTTAGIAFVSCLALVAAIVAAQFRGEFVDSVQVILLAPRSGLNLEPGARVKLLDVQVGRVGTVREESGFASIELDLSPERARSIPANIGATIASTTVFGAKFVSLTLPKGPAPQPLADGDTIDNRGVTTEVNTLFERLTTVLHAVPPEDLNATLTAISDALRGRGEQVGHTIDQANTFLTELRPSLDALQADLDATAEVTNLYADAAPGIVETLRSLTTTGSTVIQNAAGLDRFLLAAIGFGRTGGDTLDANREATETLLRSVRPTVELLDEYSTGLPCFFQGLDQARADIESVVGGAVPGVNISATLLPGEMPYRYPQDLPKVAASGGPRCGALPDLDITDGPAKYLATDTGVNPYLPNGRPAGLNVLDFMLYGVPGGVR